MINTIVFDLGGVLIDWNPEYVFLKEFRGDREKMNCFLKIFVPQNGMNNKMLDIT